MTPAEARARALEAAESAIAHKRAVYAQLAGEPFCLPMDRIARLTDRQIRDIYYHPRTKEGAIEMPEDAPAEPVTLEEEKAAWFAVCKAVGIPQERAEAEWRAKKGG